MGVTLIDPDGLPTVGLYTQVSVATGSRIVFVAGQVSVDARGTTVGVGDLTAQVRQSYLNVATALAAAGATVDDLAKITVYLVAWTPEKMSSVVDGIAQAAAEIGRTPRAPLTGIGVSALAAPDLLVEVEATAVLD